LTYLRTRPKGRQRTCAAAKERLKFVLPKLGALISNLSRLQTVILSPRIGHGLIEPIEEWRKS
jgi:hypothetical protein